MTADQQERATDQDVPSLAAPPEERVTDQDAPSRAAPSHADTQAEGLRVLLSMAVSRAEDLLSEIELRDEEALTAPMQPVQPVQEPSVPAPVPTEPARKLQTRRSRNAVWTASTGRHAAAVPPLRRTGLRFMIFSAIGGFVFLMGFAIQVVLTGGLHVLPVISYLIQAVASVEASFLLNRWLTWRDRSTPFWRAFLRFNVQKTVTIALNLALYAGLLRLGVNYLVANVVLTVAFTVVNYVAGDRLVFIPGRTPIVQPAAPASPSRLNQRSARSVSVVIPCRDNERTIGAAVQSLLDQDYPVLSEIVLVGSPGDHTWNGLADLNDPRLVIYEAEPPPGLRDANFKRDMAIRKSSSDLIALIDSDIVLPPDWISRAVTAMEDSGVKCVTGGMKSVHNSFWGRYTDSTWIGAKTPRIAESYTVTSADFGMRGRKPPITANALFTRELYEHCPIDPAWSHGSYEDYEWFWRVVQAGYGIFVCRELFGWHHHRRGVRALAKEYRRSSRGCAYFIRAHRDCPLAKRRLHQVISLPLAAIAAAAAAAAATVSGHGPAVGAIVFGCVAVLAVHQIARSRSLESLAYPVVGLGLGVVYVTSLAVNLIHTASTASSMVKSPVGEPQTRQPEERRRWRILHPVTGICAVQAALSLTLVWSNTAYVDEANYLSIGRLEIAHWLHKTSWPSTYAYEHLAGSPLIYPPLGALAASVGGVAGARILSLAFMLGATLLLYLTATRVVGRAGALFAASLWALSEPAIRMAFATIDPLSVLLTALTAWLIVQVGHRRQRGELVAAAAVALALANATSYSGMVIDPIVIGFAILVWLRDLGKRHSFSFAAWLIGTWAVSLGLLITLSHSWLGLITTLFAQSAPGNLGIYSIISNIWAYSALTIGLAVIAAMACFRCETKDRGALLLLMCFAVLVSPFLQFSSQTTSSIDTDLTYGIWFASISAGYACGKFIRWLPGTRRSIAMACCAVALVYPAALSWQSAWQRYHGWPDASSFISAFRPVAARSRGLFYLPNRQASIGEFYTPQGFDWSRWSGTLSLDPVTKPQNSWNVYYATQLRKLNYGVVVLFYSTTFSTVRLPGTVLLSSDESGTYQQLLGLVGDNSDEPGLPALTRALERDGDYRLVALGRYDTSNISGTHNYGIYAIWRNREQV